MSAIVRASGIGSLPHREPLAAAQLVVDHLPDLPHLPELPRRGRGADVVGRAAAMLVDLPVEITSTGWQVASRPGADVRAARAALDDDVAALAVAAHGYQGPLKVQVLGPWTLATALGQSRGEAALADNGLRRDLASSLTEGVAAHLDDISARLPGVDLVLQLDEPSLPAVLRGSIATRSGWGRLAPVENPEASELLSRVLGAAPGSTVVHCCAADVPWSLLTDAGATGASFDLALLGASELDEVGTAVEAGITLWVGAVPTSGALEMSGQSSARRTLEMWGRLGFGSDVLRDRTVITPACGLAGLDPGDAVAAYRAAREAAERLSEADGDAPGQ